jgi:hypothetical protein
LDEIGSLLKIWPVTVAVVSLIAGFAVALYRIKTHSKVLFGPAGELLYFSDKKAIEMESRIMKALAHDALRLKEDEVAYLKIADHERICDNSRMRTQKEIRDMKDDILENVERQVGKVTEDVKRMLETHSQLIIEAVKKNGGSKGNS